MSLTHELGKREFKELIDRFIPEDWYKKILKDLRGLEVRDALPGILAPWQGGVVCDFAVRKLLRDGEIPCKLVPYKESHQFEAIAGTMPLDENTDLDPSVPSSDDSLVVLELCEEWLDSYRNKQLPDVVAEMVLLAELESYYRSGKPGLLDSAELVCKRLDEVCTGRDQIWAWLKPIIDWTKDIFQDSQYVLLNPRFGEASRAIGGADADLWVDGCLLEIKSVKKTGRGQIRQLVGYLGLAELDVVLSSNSFWQNKIRNVGVVLVRQRSKLEWRVPKAGQKLGIAIGEYLDK